MTRRGRFLDVLSVGPFRDAQMQCGNLPLHLFGRVDGQDGLSGLGGPGNEDVEVSYGRENVEECLRVALAEDHCSPLAALDPDRAAGQPRAQTRARQDRR